jgi:hypothetical protein
MPRNISFMLTTEQIRNRTKTVTRRLGWRFLKVGDTLNAVVKCQGLKKGESVEKLATIKVVSIRREPLNAITFEDVKAEGFEDHPAVQGSPLCFIDFFCRSHPKCAPWTVVTRIEFEYVEVSK